MNVNKISGATDAAVKSPGMLKSATEIAKLISNEYLKELELKEYCKIVESDFIKYQKKFQDLMGAKNQSARLKTEYKNRNKINITNSESLLKALNELYKYKCELKLSYVTIEKELKFKRQKYKKIISGYESAWDETMRKYNKTSVIAELLKIQEENQVLEREIEKQLKLTNSSKVRFTQLKENIEQNLYKTVVKFSKLMTEYTNFKITSKRRNEKNESFKAQITSKALDFKLFRAKAPLLVGSDFNGSCDDMNIDVTIFDEIVVPSENLESQHLDEDGYSFLQGDVQRISDVSEDRVEDLEYLNNHEEVVQLKNKRLSRDLKENSMEENAKASKAEENESHYFRQQPIECIKQFQTGNHKEAGSRAEENISNRNTKDKFNDNIEGTAEKLKLMKNTTGSVLLQTEVEDEVRDIQMDCEESLSEGSYEKQYSIQREMYDCQKTSSMSSEDLPQPGENSNEKNGFVRKSCEDQQNKNLKPRCEIETNDLKSFTGFFTMGNDSENPTPSIFKLF